jgi:hypothetical protein
MRYLFAVVNGGQHRCERPCNGVSYRSDIGPSISEASRRQVLGQAMDLNFLTWIFSLGMAEQRRLRGTFVVVTPLVSSLPTVTVEASAGVKRVILFILGVHGMCWESMWRL